MSDTITLYDLTRQPTPSSWSYNAWKTRLALNYKGLAYTTAWVDHRTLKPTLAALGVAPNPPGQGFEYTVPTVRFPDGTVVTDSAAIAAALEARYPGSPSSSSSCPSLRLDPHLQAEADRVVYAAAVPLFPEYMPLAARNVVVPSTRDVFEASRAAKLGVASLDELARTRGGDAAWEAAGPGLEATRKLLTDHKKDEGPWIEGSRVCYADFVVVAEFIALKRVGGDLFEKVMAWDGEGVFRRLYEAAEKEGWMDKDQ